MTRRQNEIPTAIKRENHGLNGDTGEKFPQVPEIVQVIEPPRGWAWVDWRELWRYRELFGFFVWRDIKVKYKQTLLGAAWAILVPFFQMVIFSLIFGGIAGLPTNGLPRPVFYFAGLLPWTYFATSLGMASQSMVQTGNILTKIYFPRLIVPTAPCIASVLDLAIAFVILIAMMLYYHIVPATASLLLPVLILIAFGTAAGASFFLSALNVKYRDVRYVVPFLIQVWMYCTVIIPFSSIPERFGKWRYLYGLNPMAGVVEGFRWCLAHHKMFIADKVTTLIEGNVLPQTLAPGRSISVETALNGTFKTYLVETMNTPVDPPWILIGISIPVMLLVLSFGLYYFKRMESQFADVV